MSNEPNYDSFGTVGAVASSTVSTCSGVTGQLQQAPTTSLSAFISIMTKNHRDVNQLSEGTFANPHTASCWLIWQQGVSFGQEHK